MSVLGDIVSGIFRRSASPASATPTGGSSPQPKPTRHQRRRRRLKLRRSTFRPSWTSLLHNRKKNSIGTNRLSIS